MNHSELIAKPKTWEQRLKDKNFSGNDLAFGVEQTSTTGYKRRVSPTVICMSEEIKELRDALQAMERVPMTDEKGWLIECNIASGAPFWLKPDGNGTNDSNAALRFSRATDAQGFLDSFLVAKYGKDTMGIFKRHYSKEKYSITEHEWMDSKSNKEQP